MRKLGFIPTLLIFVLLFFYFIVTKKIGLPTTYVKNNIQTDEDLNYKNKKTPSTEENIPVTVIFAGDVMLGRNVLNSTLKNKDFKYPFLEIEDFTKKSDIFFVNLENPIIENCPLTDTGFKFCTRPGMIEGLLSSGINVVSLANNHSGNYGQEGILKTKDLLDENNILVAGLGNLVIKEVRNIKFGFLGFDFTVHAPSLSDYQKVLDSDFEVNYLVVSVHWGEEYKAYAGSLQKSWARELIINGADIMIGHHPHWVQNFECLDKDGEIICFDENGGCICDGVEGKPVYYSLGNLVFDQMWSEETKKGMLVKLEFNKDRILRSERINTYIKNPGQPQIVE